jgi:hypothetical protein
MRSQSWDEDPNADDLAPGDAAGEMARLLGGSRLGCACGRFGCRPIATCGVFLLKWASAKKMLQHNHAGSKMTCVLTGSFS